MLTPLGWAGEVTRQTRIKERFERVALESNLMVGIDRIDGQPSELEMDGLAQFLDHVLANAIWKRLDRVGTSFAMDVTAVGPELLDLKTKKKKRDEELRSLGHRPYQGWAADLKRIARIFDPDGEPISRVRILPRGGGMRRRSLDVMMTHRDVQQNRGAEEKSPV